MDMAKTTQTFRYLVEASTVPREPHFATKTATCGS